MSFRRLLGGGVLTAAAMFLSVGPAWGDAPSNAAFAGATVIGSLPYTTTEDTTQATFDDSADAAAVQACNAGSYTFSNGVWFAYTPSSDQTLQLDTSGSSYAVAGAVVTGSPAAFTPISCFVESTTFPATAGTTYYIGLSEFGGGSGGTMDLTLMPLVAPDPVLTVNRSGEFDTVSGAATVSGTASCNGGRYAYLYGDLSTRAVGRLAAITGSGSPADLVRCDGTPHPWSFVASPSSGLFKGGPATADVDMFACSLTCQSQHVTQTVTLKH